MPSLELKIPPIVVLLIAAIGLYFTPLMGQYSDLIGDHTRFVSRVVLALALVIGVFGVVTFKKAKTTVNPVSIAKASNLVTHGIFQLTRNPMYLAMALVIVAMSIRIDNVLALFWVIPFCVFITRYQIMPEERMLLSLFGKPYADYMQSVRRWL